MDKRNWVIPTVIVMALAVFPLISIAGEEGDSAVREMREAASLKLETSWDRMDGEGAGLPEIEEYLYDALGVIYYAKVAANRTTDQSLINDTNIDLTKLVDYGYLEYWPMDPIRRGEELDVASPESSFIPCAVRFITCPSSHFTTVHGVKSALSFNVFINAPVESFAGLGGSHAIVGENKEWGNDPPVGALYGLSFCTQSDTARAEVLRKIKEKASE